MDLEKLWSTLTERLGGEQRFLGAFLSGSRASGLDHKHSDTDIHVILRDGDRLRRRTFDVDGVEVQLTRLSLDQVAEFADLTSEYVATASDRTQSRLTSEQLWRISRLATARVIYVSDQCAALLKRSNADVTRQVLMANYAHRVGRAAEDAMGVLASGDPVGAAYATNVALRCAFEVTAAGSGHLYALEHFLLRRIASMPALSGSLGDFWSLLHQWPAHDDVRSLQHDIESRLLVANLLVGWSLLYGWSAPLTGLPRFDQAGVGPRRAPGFGLQRFADCWALAGPTSTLRISKRVAVVWVHLNGQSLNDVTGAVVNAGYPDASQHDVVSCVANLIRLGAAKSDAPMSP